MKTGIPALALAMFASTAFAQDTYGHGDGHDAALHINPKWRECSFQLSANLTQSAWRQFTGEAGLVTYLRPLSDARPIGRGKFEVSILQWETGIDDNDAAWNDTFVHPDSAHWLLEGNGLKFPGLSFRAGVSAKTDLGVYFTKSPGANYGFVGGQVQHNLFDDTGKNWAAAARLSFVTIYGPEDVDFTVYGADFVASRTYAIGRRLALSPYGGVSTSLSRAHETSAVVSLDDETVLGAQAMVGAVAQFAKARVALEYGVARLPTLSLKIGVGAGTK
jgi:hypothetical protein